ncbi:Outer membrane porin protein 32 precursor; putative 3-hydroxyphenylpropionic acid porine [Collimonas arenae]|uniref:Outer membrane porin protein 32 putative 3-hydroxyphenylpropionic acid porine n=1 Tax=Collimonas arenae TaxID=279058 RepID=A0A0A1F8H9_9BURK|nr:porin [Collimonas arenae]AIY39979.1 Outer membrane porin protein 32 precursor; putative 3-hydroxyphenylpropionic acid porine [Collimonas arenae]
MKYNTLTLLLATAAISGVGYAQAQTSVTIYGTADAAIVYSSNQRGNSNTYMNSGNLNASKLGFMGSEDLGGGSKAIFTLEQGFSINTGAQSDATKAFNRQAFVGLSDARYGTFTLGRQYTPYWRYVGGLGPTGVLTGATGAHPGDLDGLDTTIRINNSLVYASPVISGFQASALYGFGENAGNISAGNSSSAALRYDYNALSLALGYVKLTNNNLKGFAPWDPNVTSGSYAQSPVNAGYASARSVQMIAAAARYNPSDKWMLGLNFSNVQMTPGTASLFTHQATFNTAGLISTYKLTPAITLAAGYSYTRESAANGISDPARYQQLSLEQTYDFSKRTALYFLQAYQRARGQTLGANGVTPVNAVAVVGDSQNGSPSSNGKQFVGAIGIRHQF